MITVMYRDGGGKAHGRAAAAREALEDIGEPPVAVPTELLSPQDLEALADRLELQLARCRAAITREAGPSGPVSLRELVPYWSYEMHTSETASQAEESLRGLIASGDPFTGRMNDDGELKATPRISNRNSFLPFVFAKAIGRPYGASVRIRMRMSIYTNVFMAAWIGIPSVVAVDWFVYQIRSGEREPITLVLLAFPLFGLLFVIFGFCLEARKAHRHLRGGLLPVEVDAGGNPIARVRVSP